MELIQGLVLQSSVDQQKGSSRRKFVGTMEHLQWKQQRHNLQHHPRRPSLECKTLPMVRLIYRSVKLLCKLDLWRTIQSVSIIFLLTAGTPCHLTSMAILKLFTSWSLIVSSITIQNWMLHTETIVSWCNICRAEKPWVNFGKLIIYGYIIFRFDLIGEKRNMTQKNVEPLRHSLATLCCGGSTVHWSWLIRWIDYLKTNNKKRKRIAYVCA